MNGKPHRNYNKLKKMEKLEDGWDDSSESSDEDTHLVSLYK